MTLTVYSSISKGHHHVSTGGHVTPSRTPRAADTTTRTECEIIDLLQPLPAPTRHETVGPQPSAITPSRAALLPTPSPPPERHIRDRSRRHARVARSPYVNELRFSFSD
ncbi:hypothetical protein Aduo_016445 [Ancylostoma duodenale]